MSHGDSDSTSSGSSTSSTSSSACSSEDYPRRRHRRSSRRRTSSSGSSSSTSSSSSDGDSSSEDEAQNDVHRPSAISPLSCLLLSLILTVAGGFAVFIIDNFEEQKARGVSSSAISGVSESRKTSQAGGTMTASTDVSAVASSAAASGIIATSSAPDDFLTALASSFSMTPALVSSLSMPATALPSSAAANSYIAESWAHKQGSGQLAFVTNPLGDDADIVLEADYPKGSYSGANISAGAGNMQLAVFGESKQRAMVSYEVGFSTNFDFVKGGKLPGLFGGDAGSGCTGGRGSEACFSTRLMWRADGAGEVYAYIPTYGDQCSDSSSTASFQCHTDDGVSINRGSFTFVAGEWNTVTQVAILNSDPGSDGIANGVLSLYAGETRALYFENIVFRMNASVFLDAFIFSTFFGGSTEDYAATVNCSTYYRNFRFFEGDAASNVTGDTVQASVT